MEVNGGGVFSHKSMIKSLSKMNGVDNNNIRQKENFPPSIINCCILEWSPIVYDFTNGGLTAIIKFLEKPEIAPYTIFEKPQAALRATPKNMFRRMLEPWFFATKLKLLNMSQPEKDNIGRMMVPSRSILNMHSSKWCLQ